MNANSTGAAKFCNTVGLNGINDYYCSSKKALTIQKADTTYSGQKGRTLSTYVEKATSTSKSTSTKKTSSTSTKSSSSTSTSESSSSSEAPSSSETSSTSADSTSTSATETETAAAGAAPAETSVSTKDAPAATPVGGIVGGVIGGIALIALVALGAVFLRKRKRENQETAAFAPTQHPMKESPFHTQQPPDPFAQQPPQSFSQQPPQSFSQQPPQSFSQKSPQSFAQQPPQSFSQQPPQSFSQQPAQSPFETYATPPAQDHSHMYGAPAAGASAAGAYGNPNLSNRDPSPLSTPAASPGPQYQQPHPPAPSYYQSYHQPSHSQDFAAPAYQSYHQQPPRQSQDHIRGHGETWTGPGGAAEPIDRRSTSTPLSTYHGATPTTPASALNSMPGEQSMNGGGVPDVPLILQPGMGFRPYRPPSNSVSSTGPPTVVRIVASPPPVVVQQGPPQSQPRGQGQGQTPAQGAVAQQGPPQSQPQGQGQGQTQAQGAVAQPNPQSNSAPAIELP